MNAEALLHRLSPHRQHLLALRVTRPASCPPTSLRESRDARLYAQMPCKGLLPSLGYGQHTATHCNSLQLTATNLHQVSEASPPQSPVDVWAGRSERGTASGVIGPQGQVMTRLHPQVSHCILPHCNTRQHTATNCNTLQRTATHYNALQHTATHCNKLRHTAAHGSTLQHTATHCNTLQHTATHCNTLQHTVKIAFIIARKEIM